MLCQHYVFRKNKAVRDCPQTATHRVCPSFNAYSEDLCESHAKAVVELDRESRKNARETLRRAKVKMRPLK